MIYDLEINRTTERFTWHINMNTESIIKEKVLKKIQDNFVISRFANINKYDLKCYYKKPFTI